MVMAIQQINRPTLIKRILLHALLWLIFLSTLTWGFGAKNAPVKAFVNMLYFLPGFFLMVYSLLYFLVPRYLLKRRFLAFFTGLAVVTGLCMVYTILTQVSLDSSTNFRGMELTRGANILPYLNAGGAALSIKLLLYWYQQRKLTIEAERQKDAVELQLLKAQLHPEFLFNTLDNLYSHTIASSPNSPEIVIKLSELLRYMIYESNVPRIPLSKEIEILKTYISLEKLRFNERLDLSVTITGNVEDYQIAPFLLLPFVENAFKHGTGMQLDQSWISMSICLKNSEMDFKLVNSIEPNYKLERTKIGGQGLLKIEKRLELLYNGKYSFETKKLEEVFVVNLTVKLEELEEQYKEVEILSPIKAAVSVSEHL
jgi:sensor histidine kinase YesM